jgi:hypothetical protein
MSGFFALRREVFELIDDVDLRPRGYKILIYLYARAVRRLGKGAVRLRATRLEGPQAESKFQTSRLAVTIRDFSEKGKPRPRTCFLKST